MRPSNHDPVLNLSETAEYLGVNRTTLWRMHSKYGIIAPPARFSTGKTGYIQSYLDDWKRERMNESIQNAI